MLRKSQWVTQSFAAQLYNVSQYSFNASVYNSKGRSHHKFLYKDGKVNLDYIKRNMEFKTKLHMGIQQMYYEILDQGIYSSENTLAKRLSVLTGRAYSSCSTYLNSYIWKTFEASPTALVVPRVQIGTYRAFKKILREGK